MRKSPCSHKKKSHRRRLKDGRVVTINTYEAGEGVAEVKLPKLSRRKQKKLREKQKGFFD